MKKHIYTLLLCLICIAALGQDAPPLNPTAVSPNFTWYKKIISGDTSFYGYSNNNWVNFARREWVKKLLKDSLTISVKSLSLNGGLLNTGTARDPIITPYDLTPHSIGMVGGISPDAGGITTSGISIGSALADRPRAITTFTGPTRVFRFGGSFDDTKFLVSRYDNLGNYVDNPLEIDRATGNTRFGHPVYLHGDAVDALEPITKNQFDNYVTGITWKQEVKVATIANITLSGTQTVDGVALVANDRVLVKNQTAASQNGIYLVKSTTWVRSVDADNPEEIASAAVLVRLGTTNKNTQWTCTNITDPVLEVDLINFGQLSGAGTYTNGTGLTLTANVFDVNYATLDGRYVKVAGGNTFMDNQLINGNLVVNNDSYVNSSMYWSGINSSAGSTTYSSSYNKILTSASGSDGRLGYITMADLFTQFGGGYAKLSGVNIFTGNQTISGGNNLLLTNGTISATYGNQYIYFDKMGGKFNIYHNNPGEAIFVATDLGTSGSFNFLTGGNGTTGTSIFSIEPTTVKIKKILQYQYPTTTSGHTYLMAMDDLGRVGIRDESTIATVTRSISTSYGLLGGGTLATDRTITADTVSSVGLVSKSNLASQMELKVSKVRTVAGFSLSSDVTLANLTATDATLTFSGTYNGGKAQTIGLNLANINVWSALQTFQNNTVTTNTTALGVLFDNSTLATSAVPQRFPTALGMQGHAWNTTTTTDNLMRMITSFRPLNGATPASQYVWNFGNATTAANSDVAVLTSDGNFRVASGFSNYTTGNNSALFLATSGTTISRNIADANPTLVITNNLGTGDILRVQQNGSNRLTLDLNGLLTVTGNATFGTRLSVNTTSSIASLTIGNNIPFTTSGAFSQSGFGINQAVMTYTSSATGSTITNASVNSFGIATLVNANATTITNAFGNYFNSPTAGTNTTLTNRYSAGFNGDAYFVNIGDGPVIRSPNGTKWRITPSDTGTIILTSIP